MTCSLGSVRCLGYSTHLRIHSFPFQLSFLPLACFRFYALGTLLSWSSFVQSTTVSVVVHIVSYKIVSVQDTLRDDYDETNDSEDYDYIFLPF